MGLKPAGSTTALLRPALETAVAVAREGERATPPVPAPGPLRRYLSFARLPDPALEVARRVLDDDDDFRARVAELADEEVLGRAGWLFLTRPEGWEAELEAMRKEAAAQQIAAREDRAERDARRRLAGAEAAAARAEAAAVAATTEADRLRADLDEERGARRSLAEELERVRAELATAREERAAAIRQLKQTEALAAERAAELRAVRHELRMAQAELEVDGGPTGASRDAAREASADTETAGVAASEAGPRARGARRQGEPDRRLGAEPPPPETPVEPTPVVPAVDRAALASVVREAAQAADRLSAALAAASALVAPPEPEEQQPRHERREEPRRRPVRRRPLRLPPAVLDDSLAAAEHLVRAPGALVLVDGYNISHAQWHGMPPAEQRGRLLDACAELHARCGPDVEVVFDGAGDEPTGGALVRAEVRYRFTPAGVEADDVILARLEEEPPARPVIVASSDRRVRDGARQRGANVIGARQLLGVLRR